MSFEIDLKKSLENLDSLPAMPVTAQKLLALPLDTEEGEKEMLNLIGQDPQIYARIIGMANSPMMGVSKKISSVQEAAMLLGLTKVKSVAIGIASLAGAGQVKAGRFFDPNALWLHSMTIAMVMRCIARAMPRKKRPNEDQIFLAGLLHDIGFMVLHHLHFDASEALHQQLSIQTDRPIADVEMETIGLTHCFIGAQLAKHWNLPEEIVQVVSFHHPPYVYEIAEQNPMALIVSITERLLGDYGIVENTEAEVPYEEWELLGIDEDDVDDIIAEVNELAVQAAQLAGIF